MKLYGKAYLIAPELIGAFIEVESSGNPEAFRFEPSAHKYVSDDYEKIAEVNHISSTVEMQDQMTSWGLFQIMGYNARSMGFKEDLHSLHEVDVNLGLGCDWLRRLAKRFCLPLTHEAVLDFSEDLACAYNHGHPERLPDGQWVVQSYVDAVHKVYQRLVSNGVLK